VGEIAEAYCRHLQFWGAKLADTLSVDPARSMGQAFDDFLQRKWVESLVKGADPGDPEARFSIPEGKRPSLEYYKNTGVMPFVPGAFTALTVLSQDAFQFSSAQLYEGYRYLQEVLKYEFSFDLERPAEHFVRRSVKSFIEEAVLMPHPALPDTYNITSAGLRKLRFFARFCRPYLEAYLAVIDYLSGASADGLSEADHLKKVPAHAQRMLKRGDIVLRESVSRVTFRNALAFCHNIGAFGREDGALLATHAERLRRFLDGLE
jgi:glycerol-3-phosphate O-acyltransferase